MSFSDDFSSCMSSNSLPSPGDIADSVGDLLEFVDKLHTAWESAGGDDEMLIGGLVALGAATGIDEAVLAALGEAASVTVLAYIAACVACAVTAAGSSIWSRISASDTPSWLQGQLTAQAETQGVANPEATA
jgi:hypothetical protein